VNRSNELQVDRYVLRGDGDAVERNESIEIERTGRGGRRRRG